MKRLAAFILAVFMIAVVLVVPASAIDPFDTDKPLSLRINFTVNDKNVSGVRFALYRAASMVEYGELTLTEEFRDCGAGKLKNLTTAENQKLCETLYAYLEQHSEIVPDDTGLTDDSGLITFPNQTEKLLPGLYLLVSERFPENGVSHEAAPFIVSLPYRGEDDRWIYNMSAAPKTADTQIEVQKLWQDSGYEKYRPAYIKVELLKDAENTVYDTAVLNAENQWRCTWKDLPAGYQWSVCEVMQGDAYKSYTERVPGGFRIINTYTPPPEEILPQTGLLRWPIPVLAFSGVMLFVIGWVKLRKCEK